MSESAEVLTVPPGVSAVRRLRPRVGDVLVATFRPEACPDVVEAAVRDLKERLPSLLVIGCSEGVSIDCFDEEAMLRHGWVRADAGR